MASPLEASAPHPDDMPALIIDSDDDDADAAATVGACADVTVRTTVSRVASVAADVDTTSHPPYPRPSPFPPHSRRRRRPPHAMPASSVAQMYTTIWL